MVAKSDEKTETACVEFLKWFTDTQQNTAFSITAGYIPVKKDALASENIEAAAKAMETEPTNYLVNLPATLETIEAGVYANPPFEGGVEARNVLETSLAQKANADAAAVNEAVAAGSSRADAVAPYLTDDNFKAWLADLDRQLSDALA